MRRKQTTPRTGESVLIKKSSTFVKCTMLRRTRYFWIICLFLLGLNNCLSFALSDTLRDMAPLRKPAYKAAKKTPNHLAQIQKNGNILVTVFLKKKAKVSSKISLCISYASIAKSFKNGSEYEGGMVVHYERTFVNKLRDRTGRCDTKTAAGFLPGKVSKNFLLLNGLGIMIDLSKRNANKNKKKIHRPIFTDRIRGSATYLEGKIGKPVRVLMDESNTIYIKDRRGFYVTLYYIKQGIYSNFYSPYNSQIQRRPRFRGRVQELPFIPITKSIVFEFPMALKLRSRIKIDGTALFRSFNLRTNRSPLIL